MTSQPRNTRQRTAVSALLSEVDGFHSAQELHAMRAQLPSDEDAAALASMAQLLSKAAPAIEKARKAATPQMRLTDSEEPVAQAA